MYRATISCPKPFLALSDALNLALWGAVGKREQPARHFFQIPIHLPGFPKDAMSLHEIGEKIRSLE